MHRRTVDARIQLHLLRRNVAHLRIVLHGRVADVGLHLRHQLCVHLGAQPQLLLGVAQRQLPLHARAVQPHEGPSARRIGLAHQRPHQLLVLVPGLNQNVLARLQANGKANQRLCKLLHSGIHVCPPIIIVYWVPSHIITHLPCILQIRPSRDRKWRRSLRFAPPHACIHQVCASSSRTARMRYSASAEIPISAPASTITAAAPRPTPVCIAEAIPSASTPAAP